MKFCWVVLDCWIGKVILLRLNVILLRLKVILLRFKVILLGLKVIYYDFIYITITIKYTQLILSMIDWIFTTMIIIDKEQTIKSLNFEHEG